MYLAKPSKEIGKHKRYVIGSVLDWFHDRSKFALIFSSLNARDSLSLSLMLKKEKDINIDTKSKCRKYQHSFKPNQINALPFFARPARASMLTFMPHH